jgi:hypothetical protein
LREKITATKDDILVNHKIESKNSMFSSGGVNHVFDFCIVQEK